MFSETLISQLQAPVMDAVNDDADLGQQQHSLQEQVRQAQVAYNRATAELEQATLKQEQ
jgi:hypothetical protein